MLHYWIHFNMHIDIITTEEFKKRLTRGDIIVDTLSKGSYDAHHIPGAENISYQKDYSEKDEHGKILDIETVFLSKFKKKFGENKEVYVTTYSGSLGCGLSYMAAMCLARSGYTNVSCYREGLRGWRDAGNTFE